MFEIMALHLISWKKMHENMDKIDEPGPMSIHRAKD